MKLLTTNKPRIFVFNDTSHAKKTTYFLNKKA